MSAPVIAWCVIVVVIIVSALIVVVVGPALSRLWQWFLHKAFGE